MININQFRSEVKLYQNLGSVGPAGSVGLTGRSRTNKPKQVLVQNKTREKPVQDLAFKVRETEPAESSDLVHIRTLGSAKNQNF